MFFIEKPKSDLLNIVNEVSILIISITNDFDWVLDENLVNQVEKTLALIESVDEVADIFNYHCDMFDRGDLHVKPINPEAA